MATGYYESVDYSLDDTVRERNILRVTPLEKSWGPNYLRYGVSLDSNFDSNSSYTLRLAYQKTWLNHLGGELLAFGEIGSVNRVGVDYYQPVDERQRYFLETNLAYGSQVNAIYQNDDKLAEYRVDRGVAKLGGGDQPRHAGSGPCRLGAKLVGRQARCWVSFPAGSVEALRRLVCAGRPSIAPTASISRPRAGSQRSAISTRRRKTSPKLYATAGVYASMGDWGAE
jgi:hypothetical protein